MGVRRTARLSALYPPWSIALSHPVGPSNLTAGRTDVFNETITVQPHGCIQQNEKSKNNNVKACLTLKAADQITCLCYSLFVFLLLQPGNILLDDGIDGKGLARCRL